MAEVTTPIAVTYPEAETLKLRISVGPCRLTIHPGATGWVEGTYRDPSGKIPILVEEHEGSVRIRQSADVESVIGLFQGAPTLELNVGMDEPFSLLVEGGANEIDLELGGVPISELEIRHGAGKIDLDFESPNPVEMARMRFATGAGSFEAENLANARFAEMIAEGGAAKFELDFGGELTRDASVKITTGAAGVELSMPGTTAAKVSTKTTLGSVDVDGTFETRDGRYWTKAAVDGVTPNLEIDVTVAVGALELRAT